MSTILIIALINVAISVLYWYGEYNIGKKKQDEINSNISGIVARLKSPFLIIKGYRPLLLDLLITSAFMSYFALSGVTGFIVGLFASNIFSTIIYLKSR